MSDGAFVLDLDRANKLSLTVDISTSSMTESKENVRLLLSQGGRAWVFEAQQTLREGRGYTVEIPSMAGQAVEGPATAVMEVIVGDRYFTPWSSDVDITRSVAVQAEGMTVESSEEDNTVTVGRMEVTSEEPVRTTDAVVERVTRPKTVTEEVAPVDAPKRVPRIRSVADALKATEEGTINAGSAVDQLLANARKRNKRL
jgi:hypothetical protein